MTTRAPAVLKLHILVNFSVATHWLLTHRTIISDNKILAQTARWIFIEDISQQNITTCVIQRHNIQQNILDPIEKSNSLLLIQFFHVFHFAEIMRISCVYVSLALYLVSISIITPIIFIIMFIMIMNRIMIINIFTYCAAVLFGNWDQWKRQCLLPFAKGKGVGFLFVHYLRCHCCHCLVFQTLTEWLTPIHLTWLNELEDWFPR